MSNEYQEYGNVNGLVIAAEDPITLEKIEKQYPSIKGYPHVIVNELLQFLIKEAYKAKVLERKKKESFCIESHKTFLGIEDLEDGMYKNLSDDELEKEVEWFNELWNK